MELYILNSSLELQGVIDNFGTLIWTRRFREPGAFQLNLPATQQNITLIKDENLIYRTDDVEAGVIQHIDYKISEKGVKTLEVKGYLTTGYLSRRINWSTINFNGTVENFMRKLVNDNCINPINSNRIIPLLYLGTLNNYTEKISKQDSYSTITDILTKIADTSKLGYRISLDYLNKKLKFEVLRGTDRTINQNVIAPTIFSTEMENIIDEEYLRDSGDFKNVALIAGAGEGSARKKTTINNNSVSGLSRLELFVDANDIQDTEQQEVTDDEGNTTTEDVEIPWSEYEPLLLQRGNEKLAECEKVETFEATINTNSNNVYKKDFDLGDKVTIYDRDLNIYINTDITEIEETYEKQKIQIVPTFGNKIPNIMKGRR